MVEIVPGTGMLVFDEGLFGNWRSGPLRNLDVKGIELC
jgi:hypothetical protein